MNLDLKIFLVVLALFVVCYLLARWQDKKNWNNGRCTTPGCKGEWEQFDTDSQGGKGYKCSLKCGKGIWI